jgi:hypothetical protein
LFSRSITIFWEARYVDITVDGVNKPDYSIMRNLLNNRGNGRWTVSPMGTEHASRFQWRNLLENSLDGRREIGYTGIEYLRSWDNLFIRL